MTDAHATGWLLALLGVALLVLAGLLTGSCATPTRRLLRLPRVCADGAPIRLLIDPRCPEGICGYSCAPDRWQPKPCACDSRGRS